MRRRVYRKVERTQNVLSKPKELESWTPSGVRIFEGTTASYHGLEAVIDAKVTRIELQDRVKEPEPMVRR